MELEILAPAGSLESLTAAVRCGADAVYLGGTHLNARRGAANFDERQLASAVSFCHARNVKVYLTLNILVREKELPLLRRALEHACACGVDAVLAQDLAVAAIAGEACPELPLHASTQMGVHNLAGARMLESLGFSRAVLARELTLAEIAAIHAGCSLELESFVHGALCMSVSGQCYLSAMLGGRSGNRGLCAQPCRLPFSHGDTTHALSLKDTSLLDRLEDLSAAGVCCVKIEGRMKRPEYVAATVTACKNARDGVPPNFEQLAAVFSRSGFTQGYLDGKRDGSMFGTRQKEDVTAATAGLLNRYAALYQKERQSVPVDCSLSIRRGEPASLTVGDRDGRAVTVTGEVPQTARTAPTDEGRAVAALSKTGGTIFAAGEITCEIDPGLMLPASALNDLRRRGLEELLRLREAASPLPFSMENAASVCSVTTTRIPPDEPETRIRLGRAEQLEAALASGSGFISLPLAEWERVTPSLIRQHAARLAVELPRCLFGPDAPVRKALAAVRGNGASRALCGSLGAVGLAKELGFSRHGDSFLNITNTVALERYRDMGLADSALSFELTLAEALSLGGSLPRGLPIYGYLPLMALRACPVRAQRGSCPEQGNGRECPQLTDRLGKRFFLSCHYGVASLHNCLPLWMCDRRRELRGLDFVTLYFTRESAGETADIIRLTEEGAPPPAPHTRGLYYRGVE